MKKMMFIATDFAPKVGGIAQYIYGIINRLPPEQISAISLPISGWQHFDEQQSFSIKRLHVPFRFGPFRNITKFLGPLFFYKLMKTPDISTVYCCHAHHALMFAAWLLRKVKRIPYCVFIYGNDILIPQRKKSRSFHSYLLKSANMVISISDKTTSLARELGVAPDRIYLLPPCIEPRKIPQNQSLKQNLTIPHLSNKTCILTVGRLVERKGQDMVLQAIPTILKTIPDLHYIIVGTGEDEARLKSIVNDLQLNDFVTFAGYITDEDLPYYYSACELFVMVSREIPDKGDVEGFGIVYLEANLFGKPVLGGASGGISDAIIDGETGLLVDPTNINEIAKSIIYLLADKETASSMGNTGRERVLKDFTCETIAERFSLLHRDHFDSS